MPFAYLIQMFLIPNVMSNITFLDIIVQSITADVITPYNTNIKHIRVNTGTIISATYVKTFTVTTIITAVISVV